MSLAKKYKTILIVQLTKLDQVTLQLYTKAEMTIQVILIDADIQNYFAYQIFNYQNNYLDQIVAIKVIDVKSVKDHENSQKMLQCQIQALNILKHPNIIRCFDVIATIHNYYIITQFCNEGDMFSYLQKRNKLSEGQTLKFLKDIIEGFIEFASKNFLHRDLKLANILLMNGIAKIADFGFAKKNINPEQMQEYNVGSPYYMSPQVMTRNIYSIKNDIWSIGVIIFELLHGHTPWSYCKSQQELMNEVFTIPVYFNVKLSEQLKQFIKKCLQVDQRKRLGLQELRNHRLIKKITNSQSIIINPIQKSTFDQYNRILVFNINEFRLLYKIVQQIRRKYPEQMELIGITSQNILDKVDNLNTLVNNPSQLQLRFDIKQLEKYINEYWNPQIKKYKRVLSQYYKKYTVQLRKYENQYFISQSLRNKFRQFLKYHKVSQNNKLLFYWMIQYCNLQNQIRNLQQIMHPKFQISLKMIATRIRYL